NVPAKARKQVDKGDAALKAGALPAAEKAYSTAVALYPEFEEAQNKLGVVIMQEGRKAEGQAAFTKSLQINAAYAPAQVNLAKVAFDEKRYDDAYALVT